MDKYVRITNGLYAQILYRFDELHKDGDDQINGYLRASIADDVSICS